MYDGLETLLGYFHPDYKQEFGTPDDVVRGFAEGEPRSVAPTIDDIDRLLGGGADEAVLRTTITELGSYYLPEADGYTVRSWLAHVRDLLWQGLQHRDEFWIVVRPGELRPDESGALAGPLSVLFGTVPFPYDGWRDRPLLVLAEWLERLASATKDAAREVVLPFSTGSYEIRVRPDGAGDRWIAAGVHDARTVAEYALGIDVLSARVRSAAEHVASYCRYRDWEHRRDVQALLRRLGVNL